MDNEISMKFKAERFREHLESMLKKFPPDQYAEVVSMKIRDSFQNHRLMGRYPIHFLLHSIQANCAFYNTNRTEVLTEKKLQQVLNHYRQYFDPVAEYFLTKEDGVEPFLSIYNGNNSLLSVVKELIPLAGQSCYLQKIIIRKVKNT